MIGTLAVMGMVCAVVPAAVFCVNLRLYRSPCSAEGERREVSVLIPARDEEAGIQAAVNSVLASVGMNLEVVVMDDASTDRTAEIVKALSMRDSRVRLQRAHALPTGWNGKQHACWELAQAARYEVMCFLDADVRLEPEALVRMAAMLHKDGNSLVSGFPLEQTGTWLEWTLLPIIHFVLLGFLPVWKMRHGCDPSLAAGCGQFLMVQRKAYFACGGHSGIKATMHDGLLLPTLFRRSGFRTDLADLTHFAQCRMYRSAGQVWSGLAKNATEGIAKPARIGPITLFLFAGQVLPYLLLFRMTSVTPLTDAAILIGVAAAWLPRVLAARRFRQDWRGAFLHPFGILLLLGVQWYALLRQVMGRAVTWKARDYA